MNKISANGNQARHKAEIYTKQFSNEREARLKVNEAKSTETKNQDNHCRQDE
jgi:hypothetical protein